jgi:hypothetical protein
MMLGSRSCGRRAEAEEVPDQAVSGSLKRRPFAAREAAELKAHTSGALGDGQRGHRSEL